MQGILRVKGYYTGALDGKAGALSDTAIRNYQKAEGLDVDGSCGPKTWKSLFS
jgi:peptidoglycan hydrolase-like protein with peptidoglycan-binding domain